MEQIFKATGLSWGVMITVFMLAFTGYGGYVALRGEAKRNTGDIVTIKSVVNVVGEIQHDVATITEDITEIKRRIGEDADDVETRIRGLESRDSDIRERLKAIEVIQQRILEAVEGG